MQATIECRRFDTETATLVSTFDNIGPSFYSNFHFVSERLYVTDESEWFLVGEGGATTQYGGNGGDGSTVTPLTRREAEEWLEDHGRTEAIARYF